MAETAVIPAWVVPPPAQVADCHRLAYADAVATRSTRCMAVTATISWVVGLQEAPIVGQPEVATRDAAFDVMLAADAGNNPDPAGQAWCAGVAVTLSWLLGLYRTPPVQIPRRLDDGTTPTVEQLYTELMTGKTGLPEQRLAARQQAEKDAALHRRLAECADSVH
jgi:hypothetical protein